MEYQVITTHSITVLNKLVNEKIKDGWKPIGGHKVVEIHTQNRFRGSQHVDTVREFEYSQTMVKE